MLEGILPAPKVAKISADKGLKRLFPAGPGAPECLRKLFDVPDFSF
jgi:hypothetical protein